MQLSPRCWAKIDARVLNIWFPVALPRNYVVSIGRQNKMLVVVDCHNNIITQPATYVFMMKNSILGQTVFLLWGQAALDSCTSCPYHNDSSDRSTRLNLTKEICKLHPSRTKYMYTYVREDGEITEYHNNRKNPSQLHTDGPLKYHWQSE